MRAFHFTFSFCAPRVSMRSVFVEGGCFDIFLLCCCCCCFFVDYFTTFPAFSPSLLFQLVLIFGFVCLHNFHRTEREKTEITTFFLEFSLLPYEVRDRFVGALKQRCDDDEKRQFSKKGDIFSPRKTKTNQTSKILLSTMLRTLRSLVSNNSLFL